MLVVAYALWPGTDLCLIWPQEYLILLAWVALGTLMYWLSPSLTTRPHCGFCSENTRLLLPPTRQDRADPSSRHLTVCAV